MSIGATTGAGTRVRRYESVERTIATEVLAGQIQAGELLPNDRELTERFGVSRTVVREAIQSLAHKGLLEVRHGAGTYVNDSDKWDVLDPLVMHAMQQTGAVADVIQDLLVVRRMFEAEAVAQGALRATADDLSGLAAILARMHDQVEDPPRFLESDIEFHRGLIEASHNRVLRRFKGQLGDLLSLLMTARHKVVAAEARHVSLAGHELIYQGLVEHHPERARSALLAHIQGTERMALTLLGLQPQSLGGDSHPQHAQSHWLQNLS